MSIRSLRVQIFSFNCLYDQGNAFRFRYLESPLEYERMTFLVCQISCSFEIVKFHDMEIRYFMSSITPHKRIRINKIRESEGKPSQALKLGIRVVTSLLVVPGKFTELLSPSS